MKNFLIDRLNEGSTLIDIGKQKNINEICNHLFNRK